MKWSEYAFTSEYEECFEFFSNYFSTPLSILFGGFVKRENIKLFPNIFSSFHFINFAIVKKDKEHKKWYLCVVNTNWKLNTTKWSEFHCNFLFYQPRVRTSFFTVKDCRPRKADLKKIVYRVKQIFQRHIR